MKKLTVLMPAYNVEDYISESIESILIQKVDFEYELLIIDDKSTDGTLEIALEYQQKYPNIITVLKNDVNMRALATSIKGYQYLKTEYFCVLDPDDYYTVDSKFQNAIDFLERNPDFTIHMTNINVLDTYSNSSSAFINTKIIDKDITFDDFLNDDAILVQTYGAIFRNTVFKEGIPKEMFDAIGTDSEKSFEGDSFRNFIHLQAGKAYFKNDIESVYRVTHHGIWSSMPEVKKILTQAQLYYDMSLYFSSKEISIYMLRKSYKYFNQMINPLMQLYCLSSSDITNLPSSLTSLTQLDRLFSQYSKYKDELIDIGDWNQSIIEKELLTKKRQECYEDEINYYKNSLSWKITRPIRIIRKLLSF